MTVEIPAPEDSESVEYFITYDESENIFQVEDGEGETIGSTSAPEGYDPEEDDNKQMMFEKAYEEVVLAD